jgi:hypothetical protein
MTDKIILIDDQPDVLETFGRRLNRLFQDHAEVLCLLPEPTVEEMVNNLDAIDNVVAFIIDENLQHSGFTDYQGVELVSKIRELDSKIPIYVLTSDTSWVDPLLGDIEFVIDKVDINNKENKEEFLKKFIRHLATYKDIKSIQAQRFDVLLSKSLSNPLTADEQEEFNAINLIRSKTLLDEATITDTDLDRLDVTSAKLDELEIELKKLMDEH